MVMEGVAAGPVHQPDVWIDAAAAIEFIGLAGMQQHVGHARDGNRGTCRVAARAHFRRGQVGPGIAGSVHRAVPEGEAAAGQPIWPSSAASATLPSTAARRDGCAAATRRRSAACGSRPPRAPAGGWWPPARRRRLPPIPACGPGRRRGQHSRRRSRSRCSNAPRNPRRAGPRTTACAPCPASGPRRYWVGWAPIRHPAPRAHRRATGSRSPSACRPRARASQPGVGWSPAPPDVICVLRSAMPPKAISSRVLPTTLFQSVTRPVTGA